jgi:hypothetical protein
MKTRLLMLVIVAAFGATLISCGGGGGGKTPEEAVSGMMDAVKAKEWEKAVSFMDIDGIVAAMKEQIDEQTKDMSEEEKKQFDEMMGEEMKAMTDPKKMKEKMIETLKEKPPEFTYKIKETKDGEEGVKIVVVEITEKDKEPETEEFPVKKVGGVWKISVPGME